MASREIDPLAPFRIDGKVAIVTGASSGLGARFARVRDAVAQTAATANEVARSTGLPAGEVAAALTELELLGVVREVDGVYRVEA